MSPAPLYEVINQDLAQQIASGQLTPGEQLSSESELARHYGVSRMTLRQALSQLETDGLVVRRHGAGTFVSESKTVQRRGNQLGSFHEEIGLGNDALETRLLAQEVGEPPEDVARKLSLSPNQRGLRIQRLRLLDGKPISLQESWLPYLLAPSLARDGLIDGSLYRTLAERAGIEIARADQEVSAALVDSDQAKYLAVPVGSPVLKIMRTAYTANGEPFEAAQSLTLPDLPLVFHLER